MIMMTTVVVVVVVVVVVTSAFVDVVVVVVVADNYARLHQRRERESSQHTAISGNDQRPGPLYVILSQQSRQKSRFDRTAENDAILVPTYKQGRIHGNVPVSFWAAVPIGDEVL